MDKVIIAEVNAERRKKILFFSLLAVIVFIITGWLFRSLVHSSVNRSAITTAVVECGSIENTLNASGEVLPEFEQVITSPINASIRNVVLDAGSKVKAGRSILSLDKVSSETEYQKLKFQLESKHNDIRKLRLQLDKSFYDLKSNNDIKQLRINSLHAALEDAKRLYKAGGGTKEDIEQAELNLQVAELEKKQLENEIKNKQQTMQVEMRESEIAADIEENSLKDLARKLAQADITASRDGVITWVNKNIGSSIREGESLAKIADLQSYKVTGAISDVYIDQIKTGMTAIARINETLLRGTITTIYPSVQNGIVSFDISMNEVNNPLFRPNMKVDIFIVTAARNNVLKVANGPAFKGSAEQDIYVLSKDKTTAERKTVTIGMTNFDYVEIKNNVSPGDVIITSDMSDFKNSKTISINN